MARDVRLKIQTASPLLPGSPARPSRFGPARRKSRPASASDRRRGRQRSHDTSARRLRWRTPRSALVDGQVPPATLTIPDFAQARLARSYHPFSTKTIFDTATFPPVDFDNRDLVEAAIGPYTLHTRYFDAQWDEVTALHESRPLRRVGRIQVLRWTDLHAPRHPLQDRPALQPFKEPLFRHRRFSRRLRPARRRHRAGTVEHCAIGPAASFAEHFARSDGSWAVALAAGPDHYRHRSGPLPRLQRLGNQ